MSTQGFITGPVAPAPAPIPETAATPPYAGLVLASAGSSAASSPGSGTTQLDTPYELAASAGMARQIATDLDSANGKAGAGAHSLTEYASTASTKLRGFSFGGALTSSTERWMQQCKALHDKLGSAAENLDKTQQNYHANESRTAADLCAVR
ncbi:hypothetical protein [Kitasatospora brasiliensis]|uniref:hypothetical protein n=1 Tax=Kitasatospora brasiliensis TaxID=3058040 RepID=UPI00292D9401|nr:hypothetical protein [Kitasatospora sp. K002]